MSLNATTLKQKVAKAIDKLPDEVTVFRSGKNQYNEPKDREAVASIRGQYYHGGNFRGKNAFTTVSVNDSGRVTRRHAEKFMTVIDENTSKIKVGDEFEFNGVAYEITDLGNNLGVYFDFSLERV